MRKQNQSNRHRIYMYLVQVFVTLLLLALLIFLYAYNSTRGTKSSATKAHNTTTLATHPNLQSRQITSPPSGPKVLFFDALNGSDRIVTNEFVHFNLKSSCPYQSTTWDMTSGTLLIKNNSGYSGIPTLEKTSTCDSATHNDSAIFRLNTKQNNFSNVDVSMDYMAVAHGNGGAPNNSYDGIHMWVGYQNEYALYAATIFRWDGYLVIKKKVPLQQAQCADPSNDGCYYNLSSETTHPSITTANVWHHADILFQVNSDDATTITEKIDGQTILQGTDHNLHGPIYTKGAVGVRGDNTEFYFKNFTVTQLAST